MGFSNCEFLTLLQISQVAYRRAQLIVYLNTISAGSTVTGPAISLYCSLGFAQVLSNTIYNVSSEAILLLSASSGFGGIFANNTVHSYSVNNVVFTIYRFPILFASWGIMAAMLFQLQAAGTRQHHSL